jgi:FAD/FMN-containing dehydrogenase
MIDALTSFVAVSVRTPCVGVGGSILGGGYSWLSSEYGLTSDPVNLLDAQVVKVDGAVLWASEDPDLFFALRGAYGFAGMSLHYVVLPKS